MTAFESWFGGKNKKDEPEVDLSRREALKTIGKAAFVGAAAVIAPEALHAATEDIPSIDQIKRVIGEAVRGSMEGKARLSHEQIADRLLPEASSFDRLYKEVIDSPSRTHADGDLKKEAIELYAGNAPYQDLIATIEIASSVGSEDSYQNVQDALKELKPALKRLKEIHRSLRS